METFRLRYRILLPFVLMGMALYAFLLATIYQEEREHIIEEVERGRDGVEAAYRILQEEHGQTVNAALEMVLRDAALRRHFTSGDRGALLEAATPLFQLLRDRFNITHFYFHRPDRVNFLRVHQPARHSDRITRFTALAAEERGHAVHGVELGPLGNFTLRAVAPWRHEGKLLGYVELGEEVGTILEDLSALSGLSLFVVLNKRFLDREAWESGLRMLRRTPEWDRFPHWVLAAGSGAELPIPLSPLLERITPESGPDALLELRTGGRHLWAGSIPLRDAGDRTVGHLLTARDMTPRMEDLHAAMLPLSAALAVVGLLLLTTFYLILRRAEGQIALWQTRVTEEAEAHSAIREAHMRELEQLALYDGLTGLPNRRRLTDRLELQLNAAREAGQPLALILLDLHRLREINDTLSHEIGDAVLRQVADRLQAGVPEADTVARPGGDEFALLLPATDQAHAMRVAARIQALFDAPLRVNGFSLDMDISVGVALYPEHADAASLLMRRADVAMRQARHSQNGFAVYEATRDPYSERRLHLFGELRQALTQDSLALHYQPQVQLANNRVEMVEALLRWEHPVEGAISPSEFIPLAEHTSLIRPLTRWVLDNALAQCSRWEAEGRPLRVAVNLSANNLMDTPLPELIGELLATHQVAPKRLLLELTESAYLHEPERALEVVGRLQAMGLHLSIDDFGTGYSSLAYLKRMPVSELKIDKSFVGEMLENESDASIVASTINLAHSLDLRVVAEGVEGEAVLARLVELGCDLAQGYHIARPMPEEALAAWLDARDKQRLS